MNPDRYCLVLVTVPTREVADMLSRTAVDSGLAACCSIIPGITSIYRWESEVHEDAELQLLFKTRSALFGRLEEHIRSLHPYDVPEILMTPITGGSAPYLSWLDEATGGGGSTGSKTQG
jgi:periplasmic divalent cation tolerance protein